MKCSTKGPRLSAGKNVSAPTMTTTETSRPTNVGVSVRKLHQLYSGTGTTFATHVREMRLRGVARELADPTVNPPITEIATRWGFCDGGHLSREFRRHHDCTPTEYRAQRRHEPGRAR